jgi:hypothetical protein
MCFGRAVFHATALLLDEFLVESAELGDHAGDGAPGLVLQDDEQVALGLGRAKIPSNPAQKQRVECSEKIVTEEEEKYVRTGRYSHAPSPT